ncbi:coiled-coil domain-containing protein [Oopsacas minuta]|uniref:Coiled-coil domain-containing protein n=1 Tax=Oopsacas minuta TaxID=111878 RepID=A0AAV7JY33_9METZ|nr:coiled-coil domain-containing protein [Oopsacas minuta]
MLTECEWTSAAVIPQLEQEKSTLGEAEQLINQLTHILSKKPPYKIDKINKTVLKIEGCAIPVDEDNTHPIFVEAAELVKRCARDIAGTRAAVRVEQRVAKEYREGIDKLRRRRLKEMGGEVQREHETCLANILELQWHVSYTERKLEALRDKVRKKRRQHSLLKESEDHMTEHSPLAREKGEAEIALSTVMQEELANTETEIEARDGVRREKRDIWKSEQIQAERVRDEMLAEKNKLEGEMSQATGELREADEIAKLLKDEIEGSITQRENNER